MLRKFGTMLRKFGRRISEFGGYGSSGLRLRLKIAVGDDALGVPQTGACEALCEANSEQCSTNSDFGFRNNAPQIQISDFGEGLLSVF